MDHLRRGQLEQALHNAVVMIQYYKTAFERQTARLQRAEAECAARIQAMEGRLENLEQRNADDQQTIMRMRVEIEVLTGECMNAQHQLEIQKGQYDDLQRQMMELQMGPGAPGFPPAPQAGFAPGFPPAPAGFAPGGGGVPGSPPHGLGAPGSPVRSPYVPIARRTRSRRH